VRLAVKRGLGTPEELRHFLSDLTRYRASGHDDVPLEAPFADWTAQLQKWRAHREWLQNNSGNEA
jgi:hypothetical protein